MFGEGGGPEKVLQDTWVRGVKEWLGNSLQGMRFSLLYDTEWKGKTGHNSQQLIVGGSGGQWRWPTDGLRGYYQISPMHVSSGGLPVGSLQLLLWGMARPIAHTFMVWGTWVWTKWLSITLILQYSAQMIPYGKYNLSAYLQKSGLWECFRLSKKEIQATSESLQKSWSGTSKC